MVQKITRVSIQIMSIFDQIVHEKEVWEGITSQHFSAGARLLWCSDSSPFRRVYESDGNIYKFVRKGEAESLYGRTIPEEYQLLENLKNSDLTPRPISFSENDEYQVLVLEKLIGEQVGQFGDDVCKNKVSIWKFLSRVLSLNLLGLRHGDLTKGNLLFCEGKKVYFLDFDQSIETSVVSAILGDMFGIGRFPAKRSALRFAMHVLASRYQLLGMTARFARKAVSSNRVAIVQTQTIEQTPRGMTELLDIWTKSGSSDANAPGKNVGYYSIRLADTLLPGERPWEPRWERIDGAVNFEGKRLLELGCNLSVLSSYAELFGGAKPGLAVDHDSTIINAAQGFKSAIGSSTKHKICDFDKDPNWEDDLNHADFDIVSALSVMQWLKSKRRFLKFLARFNEILYEGHESIGIEYNRLQSVGFRYIQLVDVSERGRVVLYAKK